MSKGKVLVTGGAGFIGSHLVDVLLERDFEVTVLDCLLPQVHRDEPTDEQGWPLYLNPECQRIRGNVQDEDIVRSSLKGITHVIHLAAAVGVGQSMSEIVNYTRTNALGAAVLLEVISKGGHNVERMAVASSMSIYGEGAYRIPPKRSHWIGVDDSPSLNVESVFQTASGETLVAPGLRPLCQLQQRTWETLYNGQMLEPVPTPENKPLFPASIYAIGKRDHEEMFLVMGKALGIPTLALRLFNTYGSRQALSNPYTGVAAIFISRLMNNESPVVFEDGRQQRDFVHVSDVAEAFATVMDSNVPVWETYNVGTGHSITITQIAEKLAKLMDKPIEPKIMGKYRVGDIRHCYGDNSKLKNDFGFEPQMSFEQGMSELIEWVNNQTAVDRSGESLQQLTSNKLLV